MSKPLLSVELWEQVLSLWPLQRRFPQGGCPPTGNREAIAGILFVLKTRSARDDLPRKLGAAAT